MVSGMDFERYRIELAQALAGTEAPFPAEEFRGRRRQVIRRMEDRGLDALLLTDPSDIYYLTGYNTFEVSVHTCLVFRPGHCLLQVPSIETGPAVTTALADEISGYRWEAPETLLQPLCDSLSGCRRVGIDGWTPFLRQRVYTELVTRLGTDCLQEAGDVLDDVRIIKTDAELDCLRRSAAITARGLAAAEELIEPGVRENAVAAAGARAMLAAGSEFMSMQPIVTSGPRISVIHLNHTERAVRPGEAVFLEFGAACRRYTAPMMRTVVAGTADQRLQRLHASCQSVYQALLDTMRPGTPFDEAAAAAERALAPVADEVFFSGVFGYSVGAQFPPSWVEGTGYIARGQARRFAAGMVFHLPLCLRVPGETGLGMSDTVLVRDDGAVALSANDWILREQEPRRDADAGS